MRRIQQSNFKKILFLIFWLLSVQAFCQETLIKNGDTWSYFDQGYLNDNWYKETDFSNWKSGVTPIGYGDRFVTTNINYGKSEEDKDLVKYFIKRINIKNLSKFTGIEFKLQRDDGAIVYVNGKELYRDNMPQGNITAETKSLHVVNTEDEKIFYKKVFDKSIFKEGLNTIAVGVHQYNPYSSDCIFSMEIVGHNDPNILIEVVKNQISNKNSLEAKIDVLNYNFLLKNTTTQLEIYKNTNQSLKFFLAFISLLLLSIIAAFLFFLYRNKKNEEQTKKEIKKINSAALEKEKEMISYSNQLLYHKQHLKEIKADLKFINSDSNKAIQNIIKQIDFIIDNKDEWKELKLHFDAVYDGFYDSLISTYPTLTETELRHCMFIKLHMQTKEIARILNIDPRSVQTARYRIKKKLNLTEDQDLRSFLITV